MPRALLSFVLLFGVRMASADGPDPKLAGTYRYVGGEAERTKLTAAIEAVVSKMNAFARGIARSRLEKGNAPTAEVKITLGSDAITIARTGKPAISAPDDGSKVDRNTTAGSQKVSHTVADGKIVQDMQGKNSHSVNVFSLSGDGVTLTIHTKISSGSLPGEVVYSMTYEKR